MSLPELSATIQSLVISDSQLALDHQMVPFDIWGTRAHVVMLYQCKIIDLTKASAILQALSKIQSRYEAGAFSIDPSRGAQLTLEKELIELAGEGAGLSAHTARSRNDQVMVTELLYLRERVLELLSGVGDVLGALIALGERHIKTVMPGYTHMQPGKPTTFAHWCLAYHDAFLRSAAAVLQVLERYNRCPLGAVESFGTSWPIDRELTARLLGFDDVWEIPQDAISSRGFFQLELLNALSTLSISSSKLASDLLLFTTFEFGTVTLGEKVAKRLHPVTGSSVMPQKRNPDALELVRATAPQLAGCVTAVTGLLTALPSGYNRDQREVKEYIHMGLAKTSAMILALKDVIESLEVNSERMLELVNQNFSLTTELADSLSRRLGVPYRKMYRAVGQAVDEIITAKKCLSDLTPRDLQRHAKQNDISIEISASELKEILDPHLSIERRMHVGGTSQASTQALIEKRNKGYEEFQRRLDSKKKFIKEAKENLRCAASL